MKTKLLFYVLLGLLGTSHLGRTQVALGKPAIFVGGDSTAKNSGKGKNGEPVAGWGSALADFFDPASVATKNVAHAGTSSRTYYEGDWPTVLPQIQPGDFVLLVFGINDGSTPPGLGDETVMQNRMYLPGAEFIASSVVSGLKAFKNSPFLSLLSEKGKAVETSAAKYVSSLAETPAAPASVQIRDVPRNTQIGSPPAPDGAPGNGRYFPPTPANSALPALWIIGDSTVRNGTLGDGSNMGQWGWGAPIIAYFDLDKINLINRAFGGTSSRSFYTGFFWQNLSPQIKKGDFVLMQFGANDNGESAGNGALRGIGEETERVERAGGAETVHTFGWYLRPDTIAQT